MTEDIKAATNELVESGLSKQQIYDMRMYTIAQRKKYPKRSAKKLQELIAKKFNITFTYEDSNTDTNR